MTTLLWSSAFTQKLKRKVRRNPELRANVEQTLRRLNDIKRVVCRN